MLEPSYGEGVDLALDKIEEDDSRQALWNGIVTALNLVCDTPDAPEARRFAMTMPTSGTMIWRVPIRVSSEDQDWALLWAPDGPDAVILYVGQWPPAT